MQHLQLQLALTESRKCQVGKSIHFWNPPFKGINLEKTGFVILGAGIKNIPHNELVFRYAYVNHIKM